MRTIILRLAVLLNACRIERIEGYDFGTLQRRNSVVKLQMLRAPRWQHVRVSIPATGRTCEVGPDDEQQDERK